MSASLWDEPLQRMLIRIRDTHDRRQAGFPHWADQDTGAWTTTPTGDWTGGFWVGLLWLATRATSDDRYVEWARPYMDILQTRVDSETVFKGFLHYYGAALGAVLAGDSQGHELAAASARSLTRLYDPRLGLIPLGRQAEEGTHVGSCESSIDSLAASPLLFWAARATGDRSLLEIGARHADRVLAIHLRSDGSFIQSSSLDPETGAVRRYYTHKGYTESSSWARAQCWGMLFAVICYLQGPRQANWLEAAMRSADWWLAHVPADRVAFWDFDDPAIPAAPRDTSATAAVAAALLKLAVAAPDHAHRARYKEAGEATVAALAGGYLTPTHPGDTRVAGMLTEGCFNRRADARAVDAVSRCELIFADYYLFESLLVLSGGLDPARV